MTKEIAILLEILKQKGISITKFANETGVSRDSIYGWKDGRGSPKVKDSEIIQKWIENNSEMKIVKPNVATPENAIPTTKNEESLHKLIDSNADLVITNKKLTDLLERAMINSGNSPQVQHSQACLERIAEQGAGLQLSWKTKAEGLKVLGNFLTETVLKKEKVNK